jgi:pimeloyl-ACP methyl ester carboxylesterase/predicted glycosyltransferase
MRARLPDAEGRIDQQGIGIHYEVFGDGPETIFFLPTWSIIHSRVWKAQIPYFADHFRVVTHDPRGNGKSDRPDRPDDYGLDHYVNDALAIMDHLGIQNATMVGLSLSGLVACALAAYHPDRVRAAVSIGGYTPIVPGYSYRDSGFEEEISGPEGWQKYNRHHWLTNYEDFCAFFMAEIFSEAHSTKQIEDAVAWAAESDGAMLAMTEDSRSGTLYAVDEAMYQRIRCPSLFIHGDADRVSPPERSIRPAELAKGELVMLEGVGHNPQARYPARVNTLLRDFLARTLGTWRPTLAPRIKSPKRALYLSSPIGLGHARRDIAITRELRKLHPGLQMDWLAQDPVTLLLDASGETIHPGSARLASETQHIEAESGEHDLNAFMAIRNMDEILIKNFMVFQEAVEEGDYDLVIADEAWDIDHFWHEHPDMKRAQLAWLTDFVGWVPMPEGGAREAFLTADYNAEMIGHVEGAPDLRDRAIFVGNPDDIVPLGFGADLPQMRDWVPQHYDFAGYVIGEHPSTFGARESLRETFGYRHDEKVCIVTVGGSGVGAPLIRRILQAYPIAKAAHPDLRMIVVTGPRIDPASLDAPDGVELRAFVPNLDRHLACCDLALVQGGLTTCMELAASGTPFLYFPLRNHFEQNVHVAHRLERYGAGRKMIFAESDPNTIAAAISAELKSPRRPTPVEADGAIRAAKMLSELL